MFKNHLKIAWRSLKKQPFFTFLNTFGLAIGIAGGLLIYIIDIIVSKMCQLNVFLF